jgi:chorismate dehydratase
MIYGLLNGSLGDTITLNLDSPAICAQNLREGKADLALIPVGALPELESYTIVGDYCIGSRGKVKTVCLFSEVPLSDIKRIYLDYQSRTSVHLIQLLMKNYWKQSVEWVPGKIGFEKKISGSTAGLIIGDRAIGLEQAFPFVYDLSEEWNKWKGLPFVFACWVTTQKLDRVFIQTFNESLKEGISQIDKLVYILPQPEKDFDLKTYFKENISYEFDGMKRNALGVFLEEIKPEKMILI